MLIVIAVLAVLTGILYFALKSSRVQTFLTNQVAFHVSKQLNTTISVGKVEFAFFNQLVLKDVLIKDPNNDTLIYSQQISALIDSLKWRQKRLAISELSFKNSQIGIIKDTDSTYNFSRLFSQFNSGSQSKRNWKFYCNQFSFLNSKFIYAEKNIENKRNFLVKNLNLGITDFKNSNDSIRCNITNFGFDDGKQLFLKNLTAQVLGTKNSFSLKKLNLKSRYSAITNSDLTILYNLSDTIKTGIDIDFKLSKSKISFAEIAQIVPQLRGMNQRVDLSGHIYGNFDDLKGKSISLKTGKNTRASFDFYLNGIKNPETMYLFVDLKNAKTTFNDISKIRLPNISSIKNLTFPESFYQSGELSYIGNFSGFLSDFVAFGTLQSEMGTVSTDLSVIPKKNGITQYRGNISTSGFNLGELLKNKQLGKITFNGAVDAGFNEKTKSLSGFFKGKADQFEANNYNYKNIEFDGMLVNRMFDGLLSVNDSSLKFKFLGQVDFNNEIPTFNFNLDLEKALPGKLNLSPRFPASELGFKLQANFSGNKIDNLQGAISLDKGSYKNRNGELVLNGMELKSTPGDTANFLNFTSDFFDAEVVGFYHFQDIKNALKKSINHFIPAITYTDTQKNNQNTFSYNLYVKKLDELTSVFVPDLHIETPFILYGKLDAAHSDLQLEGSIPGFHTKNLYVNNIFIGNKTLDNEYSSKFRFGEVVWKNGMTLYNLTVDSKMNNNQLNNQISWTNFHDLTYSGKIITRSTFSKSNSKKYPHIKIEGLPSKVFIADSLWHIEPFTASIDSSAIEINNFNFRSKNQSLNLNGKLSTDRSDMLSVNFNDINLGHIEKYIGKKWLLNGILNGSVGIADVYKQPVVLSDLKIKNLEYKKQMIGDVSLTNNWDGNKTEINSNLEITKNNQKNLLATGTYNPKLDKLNINAIADNISLVILESFIKANFSNFKGSASGHMNIGGSSNKILLNGALYGNNAEVTIDYTQVAYHFSDSVYFKNDTIDFGRITMYDKFNNQGIFGGTIVHTNFNKMRYDLKVSSPKIMVLNTTPKNNEQFYGKVIGSGNLDITGKANTVHLNGTITSLLGTDANISMEYENELQQYDFLEFVTPEKTEKDKFLFAKKDKGGLDLNLTIKATPEAKVQLIYNSNIGDVIKAQGEGILLFAMDKEGKISLSGNYTVVKGDYLFTLENVLNKRFTVEQGGTIVWSGDPYNAIIDLKAIYKLKASLYDLLANYENVYQNQRIPVECKILLTDELINPTIDFEIDFPMAEKRIVDDLQQFFNTQEEMNKQILSLIVLGKFYTPEYMRGSYEAQNPNMIGTTASEVFSNQLSNWLSQISNNVDVGFNYRPGNQITNDEIELALSTQIFNDRVTINGNIGNNVNPYSNNSSQLVGDFDVNVKLVPSGKIQFKAYNRSNNNLIYETAPYTQGVGFSFKEEYNSFRELVQKLASVFRKKKKTN